METSVAIKTSIAAISALYSGEGREGAKQAVRAVQETRHEPINLPSQTKSPLLQQGDTLLQSEANPLALLLRNALPFLNWHFAGLEDGRIRPEIAKNMLTAELIGPDGLIFHDKIRLGLFFQRANLHYVTRHHAAEETFVMLAGSGLWSVNDGKGAYRFPGDIIHHPSNMPHACITQDQPLLAAWRWSGDISWESYQLQG